MQSSDALGRRGARRARAPAPSARRRHNPEDCYGWQAQWMTGWAGGLLEAEGARRLPGARCRPVEVRVFNNTYCVFALV